MTYKTLWQSLAPAYEVGEAKAIVDYVLDIRFGMSKADVICGALDEMPADERLALQHIMQRLQQAEPVQYVLGQADFCGRVFAVNPSVLIPRPETEELCHWIAQEHRHRQHLQVLDLCTGSGCIAITLALALPQSRVAGFDISQEALRTAQHNAGRLGAEVDFMPVDVLAPMPDNRQWNIIVSNPPYICDREKKDMADNVLRHEPHLALFVPDDDPLRFYRAIAAYAAQTLPPDGQLYLEINPAHAEETVQMLETQRLRNVEIRYDQYGKKRMIRANGTTK